MVKVFATAIIASLACGSVALAADLGLPPYDTLPISPPVVDVVPIAPLPVVAPIPVVPVPVPAPVVVPIPLPDFLCPPPERLPPPNLFSTQVYYMQPPPRYAAEPSGNVAPDVAEAEHYGYGRRRPPPRPLGFYGPDGVD